MLQDLAGGPGGIEPVVRQELAIVLGPFHQIPLLVVVRDEGDLLVMFHGDLLVRHAHPSSSLDRSVVSRSLSEKSRQARFGCFLGHLKWSTESRSSILGQLWRLAFPTLDRRTDFSDRLLGRTMPPWVSPRLVAAWFTLVWIGTSQMGMCDHLQKR